MRGFVEAQARIVGKPIPGDGNPFTRSPGSSLAAALVLPGLPGSARPLQNVDGQDRDPM